MIILWFIENTETFIESNSIFDYKPIELFEHQKTIFDVLKNVEKEDSTLIFYRAPTSSGKTFTPLGICKKFKVIFMCASRHISVGLGKNAVNAGIRTAFAFGCETTADVRLHLVLMSRMPDPSAFLEIEYLPNLRSLSLPPFSSSSTNGC